MTTIQLHNVLGTFLSEQRSHEVKEPGKQNRKFWTRDLVIVTSDGQQQTIALFSDTADGLEIQPADYSKIYGLKDKAIADADIPSLEQLGL